MDHQLIALKACRDCGSETPLTEDGLCAACAVYKEILSGAQKLPIVCLDCGQTYPPQTHHNHDKPMTKPGT